MMKQKISWIVVLALVFSIFFGVFPVTSSAENEALYDTSSFTKTSKELVKDMLTGYNLGNYFDGCIRQENYKKPSNIEDEVTYYETLWGNPKAGKAFIEYLASLGIQAIRLPVTWYSMLDANGIISPAWMARIQEVVDLIINNGMYCIINIHHDGHSGYSGKKIVLDEEHRETTLAYIDTIWNQVGQNFKNYGSKLLFEAFNEPCDSSKSMSPNETRTAETKIVLQKFVDTVRATGGNNANRFLVCPGYAGLSCFNVTTLTDTASDKLITSIHSYPDTAAGVSGPFSTASSFSQTWNFGCIIDEIGLQPPGQDGGVFAQTVRNKSQSTGVAAFWWDNGQAEFAMIDRYYSRPLQNVALGYYVGKTITESTYSYPNMADSAMPYYAKFYSEDSRSVWAKKYLVICSERPIKSVSVADKEKGYYEMNGITDGLISCYTSDDDITYTPIETRTANTFGIAKWGTYKLYGSTENMAWLGGNYTITDVPLPINKYKVTIDNVEIAELKEGKLYELPSSNNSGFIAYTDGTNYYDSGTIVTIDKDINLTSLTLDINMEYGAAMRINELTGIRFYTDVDTDKIRYLKSLGAEVSMGTIIAHSKRVGKSDLTLNLPQTSDGLTVWMNVPYKSDDYYTETTSNSNFEGIVGSIVDIKDNHANLGFIGRGYVSVTIGGVTKTIYANYNNNIVDNNTRCISYIAYMLRKDKQEYEKFSSHKDLIDKFANVYSDPIDPPADDKF